MRGPVEPRRPELLGGIAIPSPVRSFLAPYIGEQITVMTEIDAEGHAHVESIAAPFPLGRFAEARLREAVERSHWRIGTDGWGRPVSVQVRLVVPVR